MSNTPRIGFPALETGSRRGLLFANPWSAIICNPIGKLGSVICLQQSLPTIIK